MTRVTFGLYRKGIREPNATMAAVAAAGFIPPSPFPTASAAIVRHHRESPDAAWRALDRSYRTSTYWGRDGTPQAVGWANAMRVCYRTYQQLAAADPRPAFATGLNRNLALGTDELGVYIDVVLLDSRGYVPRLVLWDKSDLTIERARLYAAPVWRVLEDELGEGRIAEVEVWHLRSAQTVSVAPHDAEATLPETGAVIRRLLR